MDEAGKAQAAWRPKYVFHFIQDRYLEPGFVVDITEVFEQRMEAIKAYSTQFYTGERKDDSDPQSYISTPEFLEGIIARARLMGKKIGVKYGEGFITDKSIGVRNLDTFTQMVT